MSESFHQYYKVAPSCCSGLSGGKFHEVLNFGNLFLNRYPQLEESSEAFPRAPIELVWNDETLLLQNRHQVYRSSLYDEYWYRSGLNESMVAHLKEIVKIAVSAVEFQDEDDCVVDIASNDGTLLRQYAQVLGIKLNTIGYDPALNLAEEAAKGVTVHYPFCFSGDHYLAQGHKPAKVVTACAVLYHLPDMLAFFRDIEKILDDDGVAVIEFSYLLSIIENNAFDAVGHEHLSHISLLALERILHQTGLRVYHAHRDKTNSGTVVLILEKAEVNTSTTFDEMIDLELVNGMDTLEFYQRWAEHAVQVKRRLQEHFLDICSKETIFGYGASTKGSILLQWLELNHKHIPIVADRNPAKVGRKMVGVDIPIVTEEYAREKKPDAFLVLPWAFRQAFIAREHDYLNNGGRLIFPLPKLDEVKM